MDEEADLALLDQHLLKTNMLSQRMTGILAQLDTRLSRLDKTIAPLGIQPLTRKAANIDAILLSLSPASTSTPAPRMPSSRRTSSSSVPIGYSIEPPSSALLPIPPVPVSGAATPADETAILTRGPDLMALGEYFSAMDAVVADLERMWKALNEGRGGAREAGVKDLSNLVEIGFGGLVQLFLQISKDGTSRIIEANQLLQSGPPSPPHFFQPLNTLLPISTYMAKLLSPSSPNVRTQSIVQPLFDDAMSTLADSRGDWMMRSMNVVIARVDEIDEGGIWEGGRGKEKARGLMDLWELLLIFLEAETLVITSLFPTISPRRFLPMTFTRPLAAVTTAFTPTLNTIKKALSSHTYIAFDLYQSLTRLTTRWDQALQKCLSMTGTPSSDANDLRTALNGPVSILRGLCLRSFPELLVDIRTTKDQPGVSTSFISEITYSTLAYIENLPNFEKMVDGLLKSSHAERSWLMGAKEAPSPARSAAEEGGSVNLFVADILGTLLAHLDSRARPMRRPVAQTFLLNNLSHIRNTATSFAADIIGPTAEDMLNKSFRDAKGQYVAEWTALSSLLTNPTSTPRFGVAVPGSSGEKSSLKEASATFFDRLAELEQLCSQYPLNRQDSDLRDRVGKEVGHMVGAAYASFWSRCSGKGLEKYLRGSPAEVQRRVGAIFG